MCDNMAQSFTTGGGVNEEAQRHDRAIVKPGAALAAVAQASKGYDFSFAPPSRAPAEQARLKPVI